MDEKRTLTKRAFERLRENIFRDDVLNKRRRPMAAPLTKSARLLAKSACSPAFMAPRSLRAAKPRRSLSHSWHQEDMQRLDLLFRAGPVQALHAALQLPAIQRR